MKRERDGYGRGGVGIQMECIILLRKRRCIMIVFFFFQAEDGIRDYKVTGVQTCALPIYTSNSRTTPSPPDHFPTPALPRRKAYVLSRRGYSISSTSTGVFRVFDIPTCTPDGPGAPWLAPCPPPIVS